MTDGSIGQIDGAASEFQTDLGYRMYVPLPYVSGVQARSRRPREPPTPRHTLAVCFPRYVFPRSNHRRPLPCCSYTLCKQLISEAFRRDISSQVESFFPFFLKEFRYMNSRILHYSKTRIKRALDIFEKRINFKEKF